MLPSALDVYKTPCDYWPPEVHRSSLLVEELQQILSVLQPSRLAVEIGVPFICIHHKGFQIK